MSNNPIYRLVCYLLIAGLGALISQGTGIREKLAEMNWMDWILFVAGIVMAMATAWRAFIDQSVSQYQQTTNAQNTPSIGSTPVGSWVQKP